MASSSDIEPTITSRDALLAHQRAALAKMLAEVRTHNPFQRARLADVAFDPGRDDFAALPLTTRAELQADQERHSPFGSNLTYPLERYCRYHQTSGTNGTPLRWLDTSESWAWWLKCWQHIYRAAGVKPDDRLVFPFSFGPFVGFWSAFEAATALGNLCLPAGGMSTSARLSYIIDNRVTVVCCTPTYALRMGEKAREVGIDLPASAVRALIVAGEPGGGVPTTRQRIEALWGARLFDHVGMTEVGAWGFETTAEPGVVQILETQFIAEVIDPDSRKPVADGEPGELVLTNLGRWGSPLIRYRTGDRVRLTRGGSTGSVFARIVGGIEGRVDDMLFIRGNNVFPAALEGIVGAVAGVAEFQLRVRRRDAMDELVIEVEPRNGADGAGLVRQVSEAVRDRLHFAPQVKVVAAGVLPRFDMKSRRVVRENAD